MEKKLYDLMDWAEIEEVTYAESSSPQNILGPHNVGRQTLVQAYFPGSKKVVMYIDADGKTDKMTRKGKTVKEEVIMEQADENGFYAALLPGKNRKDYSFHVEYETDELTKTGRRCIRSKNQKDVYQYTNLLTEKETEKFLSGTARDVYKILGSHRMTINGVLGCRFAVWAPDAIRVSVFGDFNDWNHEMYQMMRVGDTGIFELFIPGVDVGARYQYEILKRGYEKAVKADPYCLSCEKKEELISIVSDSKGYRWQDEAWVKARKKSRPDAKPFLSAEVSLVRLMRLGKENKSFKQVVEELIQTSREMHYTHLEFMPIVEDCNNGSAGYCPALFFSASPILGEDFDFGYLVNELHKAGIGVIMQWNIAGFEGCANGLGYFDGTGLYEYEDKRMGIDVRTGMHIFQYGRPEVKSFLLSATCYWIEQFHLDGIKICNLSNSLYLDYYRQPGNWVPNMYGGNENLDFISFIKLFNQLIHTEYPNVLTIADDESGWPNITLENGATATEEAENNSLGFDLACDNGSNKDILDYLKTDPFERKNIHEKLLAGTYYQNNENFILPINHKNISEAGGNLISLMAGNDIDQKNHLKLMLSYLLLRPGKKQVFYGVEEYIKGYAKALYELYLQEPALQGKGDDFAWINHMSANENVISFVRKHKKKQLFVVFNFANVLYPKYRIGSDAEGQYKELFHSDSACFGGNNEVNEGRIPTREVAYDGKPYSFVMKLAPLSVSVMEFNEYTDAEQKAIAQKKADKEKEHMAILEARKENAEERQKKKEAYAKEKTKILEKIHKEKVKALEEARKKIFS